MVTQWSYQRTQTSETISGYQATRNQFSECFFHHAGEQVGTGDDVIKEGCTMLFQVVVNNCELLVPSCDSFDSVGGG